MPEDEEKFDKITYNYYEQLNGYTYLKSLGIGYHFYQGRYTDAVHEVLDTDRKTILHIPHVGSGESTEGQGRRGRLDPRQHRQDRRPGSRRPASSPSSATATAS